METEPVFGPSLPICDTTLWWSQHWSPLSASIYDFLLFENKYMHTHVVCIHGNTQQHIQSHPHTHVLISLMRARWEVHGTNTHGTHTFGWLTSFHSTISSLLSALSPAASLDYCAAGQKRGGRMERRTAERMEGRRQEWQEKQKEGWGDRGRELLPCEQMFPCRSMRNLNFKSMRHALKISYEPRPKYKAGNCWKNKREE